MTLAQQSEPHMEKPYALLLFGIYKETLTEIIDATKKHPDRVFYIQPYSATGIKRLRKSSSTPDAPIQIFLSTTKAVSTVAYQAEIVGWSDKTMLSPAERQDIDGQIRNHQEKEGGLYPSGKEGGKPSVNLIHVVHL